MGGHEPCGVVVARGEGVTDDQVHLGARVMNHHYSGCGSCSDCRTGTAFNALARMKLTDLTHGQGAEMTLDCTGSATARAQAVRSANTPSQARPKRPGPTTASSPYGALSAGRSFEHVGREGLAVDAPLRPGIQLVDEGRAVATQSLDDGLLEPVGGRLDLVP